MGIAEVYVLRGDCLETKMVVCMNLYGAGILISYWEENDFCARCTWGIEVKRGICEEGWEKNQIKEWLVKLWEPDPNKPNLTWPNLTWPNPAIKQAHIRKHGLISDDVFCQSNLDYCNQFFRCMSLVALLLAFFWNYFYCLCPWSLWVSYSRAEDL